MRIAVVSSHFPVLSQTFVLNQITALIDAGHDVTIIASPPRDREPIHDDVEKYGLMDRVVYWEEADGLGPQARLQAAGRDLKGIGAFFRRGRVGLRNPGLLLAPGVATMQRRLRRAARLRGLPRFDAILAHFGTVAMECRILREMGALEGPLATVFHGYDMSIIPRERGNDFYSPLLRDGELFLPISDFWRRRLLEMGAAEDKIRVHHMGIDPERFRFSPRRSQEGKGARILTIGRFVEKKGIDDGIRAFARIAGEFPAARYTIIGDGELRGAMEELASTLGVAEKVDFVGWARREEVLEMIFAHDLLMVPSKVGSDGDMEGIPVVLMEGMATGMPVVSTEHSGIPELVAHQESGFLAPEGDVESLVKHLRWLLNSPQKWEVLGRRGRQIVEEEFSLHVLNERLVQTLEALG